MNSSAKPSLVLNKDIYSKLLSEAELSYPNECIGLVFATKENPNALRTVVLKNVAKNPQVTYLAEPLELLKALKEADELEDDLVAIYHSHPNGPNHPSETDLAKAYYDVPALIILPKEKKIHGYILNTKQTNTIKAGTKKEDDPTNAGHPQNYYEIELVIK